MYIIEKKIIIYTSSWKYERSILYEAHSSCPLCLDSICLSSVCVYVKLYISAPICYAAATCKLRHRDNKIDTFINIWVGWLVKSDLKIWMEMWWDFSKSTC